MFIKYLGFIIILVHRAVSINNNTFPDNFLFGVATASHQIEGAWNTDGKGENIWDYVTHHHPEYVRDRSNADIACDSYHKYKEDVQLAKDLGVNFYRISLSWSRILPTGLANQINQKGIDYYKQLLNEMKLNGIQPVVTLFHWDLPQRLQELGGWTNPAVINYFKDYAEIAFENFGDSVKYWTTFNEPKQSCQEGYDGRHSMAPALDSNGIGDYLCSHNIIKAHAEAYHLYNERFKPTQKGKVSIVIDSSWYEPINSNPENVEAQQRILHFTFGIYANPIFLGNYPQVLIDRVNWRSEKEGFKRSRLPKFTSEEIKFINGTFDFLAMNTYTSRIIEDDKEPDFLTVSRENDIRVKQYVNSSWPTSASDWLYVYPEGFRRLLVWIKDTYNNPEILVTENGVSDKGELNDQSRVTYYRDYLSALLDAYYYDKVRVFGYTAWSLMDNFEWMKGYTEKFGLYHVDFNSPNRTRQAKSSAEYYKNIIKNRRLV